MKKMILVVALMVSAGVCQEKGFFETIGGKADAMLTKAGETASELASEAKDKVISVADDVAEGTKSTASNLADKAKAKASEVAANVKSSAKATANDVASKVAEATK